MRARFTSVFALSLLFAGVLSGQMQAPASTPAAVSTPAPRDPNLPPAEEQAKSARSTSHPDTASGPR